MPENNKESGHGGRRNAYSNEVKNKGEGYRRKREKNNEAVRKCRALARQNAKETYEKVGSLKVENARLEAQINETESHLAFLKKLLQKKPATMDNELQELMRYLDAEIGGQSKFCGTSKQDTAAYLNFSY